jgi:hypothetical protein
MVYYYDHRADIDRRMSDDARYAEELRAATPSLL